MASLQVGDLLFHFAAARTESFTIEPVMDPSGRHFVCNKLTLDLVAVVNRVAVATNRVNPKTLGPDFPGDSLPNTVFEVSDYLSRPRRAITYKIGGVTVLEAPRRKRDGTRLASDAQGGPFPQVARFSQFSGDKTALLLFRVVTYDSENTHGILAHHWEVSSSIDNRGYSTRTISGQVRFRKDFLDSATVNGDPVQPDFFRRAVFPPVAEGTRRVDVQVGQPTAGDTLTYSVTDKEVTFGLLGPDSDATEIVGTVTSTFDCPVKSPKDALKMAGAFVGKLFSLDLAGAAEIALDAALPNNRNVGVARAYGRKGADRVNLARVCKSFLVDRFDPLRIGGDLLLINALSVTHNLSSEEAPFAEVRIDVFGSDMFIRADLFENGKVFKLDPNYRSEADQLIGGPELVAPQLPAGNARGTWLRRLVSQVLAPIDEQNDIPANHPADAAAVNANKF